MNPATGNTDVNSGGHQSGDVGPWWRQGWCWLVIVGPLTVVIAGFTTMYIAYHVADSLSPVYISDHVRLHPDPRIANSLLPAEAVSTGAVARTAPAK